MLLPRGHHYFHSELFGCFRSSYKCHLLAPFRKKIIRASRINSMHSFRRVGSTLNSAVIDTGPSCGAEGDGRHLLAPPRRVRRALSEVLGVAGSTRGRKISRRHGSSNIEGVIKRSARPHSKQGVSPYPRPEYFSESPNSRRRLRGPETTKTALN